MGLKPDGNAVIESHAITEDPCLIARRLVPLLIG
jgi:hypothetical protein